MPSSKKPQQTKLYGKRNAQASTKSAVKDMNELPRAAQALRLRRLGYTYAEIAAQVGYANESGARYAVKKASARIVRDEARELVGWQADMIEAALRVVNERIQKNDKYSMYAVDRLVALSKRYSELMGLDAPKPEHVVAKPMVVEIPAPIAQALRGIVPPPEPALPDSESAGAA